MSVENKPRFLWFCMISLSDWFKKPCYLLRVLIDTLACLRPLRLARVISLILVLQHSIENSSKKGYNSLLRVDIGSCVASEAC